jgi:hypothetical protein
VHPRLGFPSPSCGSGGGWWDRSSVGPLLYGDAITSHRV